MSKKQVTSEMVAQKANVSRTTVSFVMNNSPGKHIPEKTKQKVLKAMKELNYTRNETRKNSALKKNSTVGLFICHSKSIFSDEFIIKLVEGMSPVFNQSRTKLILEPIKKTESGYKKLIQQNELNGIILINTKENDTALIELVKSGYPVVLIGTNNNKKMFQVDINNRISAYEMVRHLIDNNHHHIGMICHAPLLYSASRDRFNGFKDAMTEKGLNLNNDWIRIGDFNEISGYEAMLEILNSEKIPSAIFAGNDAIAFGAMDAIKESGLKIPDNISIVGFDDDILSRYLNPSLTTMATPAVGIGETAARMLVNQILGKDIKTRQILLDTTLTERDSVKRL